MFVSRSFLSPLVAKFVFSNTIFTNLKTTLITILEFSEYEVYRNLSSSNRMGVNCLLIISLMNDLGERFKFVFPSNYKESVLEIVKRDGITGMISQPFQELLSSFSVSKVGSTKAYLKYRMDRLRNQLEEGCQILIIDPATEAIASTVRQLVTKANLEGKDITFVQLLPTKVNTHVFRTILISIAKAFKRMVENFYTLGKYEILELAPESKYHVGPQNCGVAMVCLKADVNRHDLEAPFYRDGFEMFSEFCLIYVDPVVKQLCFSPEDRPWVKSFCCGGSHCSGDVRFGSSSEVSGSFAYVFMKMGVDVEFVFCEPPGDLRFELWLKFENITS